MKKQQIFFAFIMALALFLLSACGKQEEAPSTQSQGGSSAMEQIWKIDDPNDLMIALSDHVAEKCQYGEDMSALSAPERTFFITQSLEMEVNNGGFSQFFYNTGGNFSGEVVAAFNAIGAEKTAAICQQAIFAFGQELPADREARLALLDACESDELDEALEECDNAFYEYQDDLTTLNYTYVLKHKASFT